MRSKGARDERSWHAMASYAVTLSMILAGCLLYDRLPQEMAVHFSDLNQPDSYMPRAFAVFAIPLIMLGMQLGWVAAARAGAARGCRAPDVVLWIVPAICICVCSLMYAHALGLRPDIGLWTQLAIGTILVLLGNVMPKNASLMPFAFRRRQLPMGLRQKIVRFRGYCLVICGLAMCMNAFAGSYRWFLAIAAAAVVLPATYDGLCRRNGTRPAPP